MSDIKWASKEMRLGDLIPRERNPRKISEYDAANLKTSVDKFGQPLPLIMQPDGTLIDGHQRQKVLTMADEYGEDFVVDVRVPSRPLTDEEIKELAIRIGRNTGEWDWDVLYEDFDKEDLVEWGFRDEELGEWKRKTHRRTSSATPELEISPELFERHDYLLIVFDNEFDWQVACELLGVKTVKGAPVGRKTIQDKGLGRVITGGDFLRIVNGSQDE